VRDKVVIITGASRGIGRATALEFAKCGCKVALAARGVEELKQVKDDLASYGGKAMMLPTDIRDNEQVHNLAQRTIETWGQIDILVNNAGITHHMPLVDMPMEQVRSIVETNLLGAIMCIKEVLPHFIENRRGHIVNISSILGKRAVPNQAVYAASKFALMGLSEALRSELAPYDITVTSFCPSSTSTEMNRRISLGDHPLKQFIRNMFILTPDKVARSIVRATRLRRREVVQSLPAKLIVLVNKCCPQVLDWLFEKLEKPSRVEPLP